MLYSGKCIKKPHGLKISKKRIEYLEFVVEIKKKRFKVLIFDKAALYYDKKEIKENEELLIDGTIKEEPPTNPAFDAESLGTIFAKEIKFPERDDPKEKDPSISKARKRTSKLRETHDTVEVWRGQMVIWQRKEDCIMVNGQWKDQLEFAMDILGGDEVTKLLKEKGVTYGLNDTSKQKEAMRDIINLAILDSGMECKFSDEIKND